MKVNRYGPSDFLATSTTPAAIKAQFANNMQEFIKSGWLFSKYTLNLHVRLITLFGHTENLNVLYFWNLWFHDDDVRLAWCSYIKSWPCRGLNTTGRTDEGEFSWCDVESALQFWIMDQVISDQVLRARIYNLSERVAHLEDQQAKLRTLILEEE